jgi:hypothetical protein
MWTPANRRQYSRIRLRYQTDLTDAEWALIEPLLPQPAALERPRSNPRLSPSLPLRRSRDAPHPPIGTRNMNFGTGS